MRTFSSFALKPMLFSHNFTLFKREKATIYLNPLSKVFITTLTPSHMNQPKPKHEHEQPLPVRTRPLSPHLTIYQPQLTWIMSIGHRVTGAGLATAIYGFGMVSAAAQDLSLTTVLAELITAAPLPLVLLGKFIISAPFAYHILNGLRHLIWDTGRALSLKGVYTTGWIVNIGTIISASLLTFL